MSIMERPAVTVLENGGKCWEHRYDSFELKAYVPANHLDGQANNWGFRAPLLVVLEEHRQSMAQAVAFAEESGLAAIAASVDSSVLFVYPTCAGGWPNATAQLYTDLIAEVRLDAHYEDGLVSITDFFTRQFKGYFIRGAKFRADLYGFGASADYIAKHLLKTIQGEFLWGPGEITPAVCSMQGLSVKPDVQRRDIPVISVGNAEDINAAFAGCEHVLIKAQADYPADYAAFVRHYKMWCGHVEQEPDLDALGMREDAVSLVIPTSAEHLGEYKGTETHPAGYFAYYNKGLLEQGPVPLLVGFHGGGDSSMYLTFVAGWWEIAHRYNFLFVSIENHQNVNAEEAVRIIDDIRRRYPVDEKRIYATGFSMGSGKTWDLYQQYPGLLAGIAPCSALFPVRNNPFAPVLGDRLNTSVAVPVFYSGGEDSHLPELPFQQESCLERVQYVAGVNDLTADFESLSYAGRAAWEEPVYGAVPDRVEAIPDPSRGSTLTVRYYNSKDGVCRTAFASVSGQIHECRHHSCENAWKFICQFTRE